MRKALGLLQRAQTAAADVQALGSSTLLNGDPLDIGQPAALGCHLGMANVVAELWPFSADITLHWHRKYLFLR
jgi:hypothetical protein